MIEGNEKNNTLSREDLMKMYDEVNGKANVTYINFVTTMGQIRCSNKIEVKFKVLEPTESGPKELTYSAPWDKTMYETALHIVAEANSVNGGGLKRIFKLASYSFYLGSVEVINKRSEVTFRDSYIVFDDVKMGDEIVKNLMIKYSDIDFIYTI